MKPLRFRLYLESSTLYVSVQVWPTKKALHAYARGFGLTGDMEGVTFTSERTRGVRLPREIAEVNLAAKRLWTETITHEMAHATWAWARRVGWERPAPYETEPDRIMPGDPAEERFCYILGRLVEDCVIRAVDLGLMGEMAHA